MSLRPVFCACLFSFCLAGGGWAATPVSPAEPVLELPKYVVRNEALLPPRESWRYTAFPGFEVLAQTSDYNTVRFLRDFQMLQQVIDVVWPDLTKERLQTPTMLVLYDSNPRLPGFMDPEVRVTGNGDELEFTESDGGVRRIASSHYADAEAACIVVNLGARLAGASDPYRQFYREYVSYLIERRNPRTAWWLREGVSRVFGSVDFTDKWFTFGQAGRGRPDGGSEDFTAILGRAKGAPRVGKFPSLEAMLRRDRTGAMNSWGEAVLADAFVHMCIYGRGHQYQKGFFKYISRAEGNFVSEDFFAECFGMSIRQMQDEIQGYASFTDHTSIVYKAKKGHEIKPTGDPKMREATQAEIGRIKGDSYRLARRMDSARVALLAPYLRHEADANLLAALGIFEIESGRLDRARQFLEGAVAGRTTRVRAGVELAKLRAGERPAEFAPPKSEQGPWRRVTPAELPSPKQREAQRQIFELLKADSPASAADLAGVKKIVADNLDSPNVVFAAVMLYAKSDRTQEGIDLIDRVQEKLSPTDAARFAKLRANLVRKLGRSEEASPVRSEDSKSGVR